MNNKYALNSITVNGDGNAIGTGNIVNVLKEHHVHHHNNRNGGGGGESDGKGEVGTVLGGLLAIALAIAALSYWFAKYESQVYTVAFIVALLEGAAAFCAIAVTVYVQNYAAAGRNVAILTLAAVLAYTITSAVGDYNPRLTELANQAIGFKEFWCQLNLYGQQSASRHALLASLFVVPGVLLLMPHAIRSVSIDITGASAAMRVLAPLAKLSPARTLVVAGGLCFCAVYGDSAAGGDFWAHRFAERVTMLCPAR